MARTECPRTQTDTMAMQENTRVPLSPDAYTCKQSCLRHKEKHCILQLTQQKQREILAHIKNYVFIFLYKILNFNSFTKEIKLKKKERERIQRGHSNKIYEHFKLLLSFNSCVHSLRSPRSLHKHFTC